MTTIASPSCKRMLGAASPLSKGLYKSIFWVITEPSINLRRNCTCRRSAIIVEPPASRRASATRGVGELIG